MLSEQDKTFLGKIFLNYNFTMTTAQLNKEKLYYRDIQRMLDEGLIEKVKRGYYHWIEDYGTSEVALINSLFPDAVFCMETALFFYKYSDRNPAEWNITVDKNTSRQRMNIDYPFIKAYRVEPALLHLGETDGIIEFTKVRIYDRDRTICDVLRNMSKMDKEIFNKAIQRYVNDPQKNIPNLMEYAKALRVQKKVNDLIGVWL
ncbi:MAG: type IV toxin-antitoxin system AbiEi family antitoxin domain-containing protein [Firmicutes bacterium]|nr:type IV toxin-antitoxin system AbiEi family antitoxin domain-containing protein [Bacillota bacterium]